MADKKITEIQKEYKEATLDLLPSFIEEYINDGRPGVSKIINQAMNRMEKLRLEKERIERLKEYEYK
jgi:ribonuclease HII